jgi:hypothetical protein
MDARFTEAAGIARRYHWPEQADALARGELPQGFAREVGSNIALFLAPPVISMAWVGVRGWTRQREDEERQENRAHARQLVRLRILLAELSIASRAEAGK